MSGRRLVMLMLLVYEVQIGMTAFAETPPHPPLLPAIPNGTEEELNSLQAFGIDAAPVADIPLLGDATDNSQSVQQAFPLSQPQRLVWRKVPLRISLPVGQERLVHFPAPVRVGIAVPNGCRWSANPDCRWHGLLASESRRLVIGACKYRNWPVGSCICWTYKP